MLLQLLFLLRLCTFNGFAADILFGWLKLSTESWRKADVSEARKHSRSSLKRGGTYPYGMI